MCTVIVNTLILKAPLRHLQGLHISNSKILKPIKADPSHDHPSNKITGFITISIFSFRHLINHIPLDQEY